ncbi:MAG: class I SAM-dependent methyltransferase, partial [Thermocrispum sp.]
VSFVHYDGARLPFDDDEFDSAVSLIAIQHSPPAVQLACLVELQRVVRPGGVLALQIPTRPKAPQALDPAAMRARIESPAVTGTLGAGQSAELLVTITNDSAVPWDLPAQVQLGNHWRQDQVVVTLDDGRALLPRALMPGQSVTVPLVITAPAAPGDYVLELDLLQESVSWWAEAGGQTARLAVSVIAMPAVVPAPGSAQPATYGHNGAEMEMYGIDENLVRMLFTHLGCVVIASAPDTMAGEDWESNTYVIKVG